MAGRNPIIWLVVVVVVSLGMIRAPGAAFELGIQTSPAVVSLNRELTYSLTLTNRSGGLRTNVVVNSTFNVAVELVSTTNRAGTAALEGSAVVFRIPQLPATSNAVMGLVIQPLSAGLLTNNLQLLALNIDERTNTVNRVFAAEANLGVGLNVDTNVLVTGDWTEFRLTVTNAGPESVPQVMVTNFLPAGAQFLALTPSSVPVTVTGTQVVFSAGALAVSSNRTYRVRLQANNVGSNLITAEVNGPDVSDPVDGNNRTNRTLVLAAPQTSVLTAAFVSAQVFNPQTGLMEQVIRLSNPAGPPVAGGRIVFPQIAERVFNASGTNDGQPFAALTRSLAAGESAELRIEYFVPSRTAFPNPAVMAWAVPAYVARASSGLRLNGLRGQRLAGGGMLLEFPAEPGRTYEVVYDGEVGFTDSLRAMPSVTAPGDRVQWIDAGPPKTSRRPEEAAARFYRIIEVEP